MREEAKEKGQASVKKLTTINELHAGVKEAKVAEAVTTTAATTTTVTATTSRTQHEIPLTLVT